jgi:hypothetical protein
MIKLKVSYAEEDTSAFIEHLRDKYTIIKVSKEYPKNSKYPHTVIYVDIAEK